MRRETPHLLGRFAVTRLLASGRPKDRRRPDAGRHAEIRFFPQVFQQDEANSRPVWAARSTVLWFPHNPRQPVDSVVMEDLARNRSRQRETLVAVPLVLNGLLRREEFPTALINVVPLCERLSGIVLRQDDQVGRIRIRSWYLIATLDIGSATLSGQHTGPDLPLKSRHLPALRG